MEIVLTVSQCVEAINFALESLGDLTVEGEVSEFRIIQNKWVTFDIKDKNSVLKCFMTVWNLRTQIEDGMLVKVTGQPNLRAKGFLSFVAKNVRPSGEGSLKRALELLKKKLEQEGLFSFERKRPLPRFPQHIALITSKDAAAYNDFIKVLAARQGGLHISFIHTQVQGLDAPEQIIAALATANTELQNLDAIVLVRGGGSMEDLMAFNDEHVVRAVSSSRTPTIVAIGHERDVCLAELAADIRASTPSNAAELLVRSREEIALDITRMQSSLSRSLYDRIAYKQSNIISMTHSIGNRLKATSQNAQHLMGRITSVSLRIRDTIGTSQDKIEGMKRILLALSPEQTLKRGYSITRTKNGAVVKKASDVKTGEEVTTTLATGSVVSVVQKTTA
jgi:exodeoxyribonuclease VII large subunit